MNRKLAIAIAVFGLLTASCELRADLRLEFNEDESGTVLVTFGLDEEFQALVESSDEPIEDSLFGADNPFGELPGADTRTYTEGDFTFYEASVPFSDLNGLRLLGSDADNFINEFDISIGDETARITGKIDLGELTGGDLADDQLAGFDSDALADIFKFHIQIDMPGTVTDQNADRTLDDGTLEWDIPLTADVQSLEIVAESSLAGGGGGFPAWLIVLIVLALVAAVLFFVMRSRRSGTPIAQPPTSSDEGASPTVTEFPAVEPPGIEPPPEV